MNNNTFGKSVINHLFQSVVQNLCKACSACWYMSYNAFLSTRALFSSKKLFTSFMFFSLNMNNAEALSRIIGAKTLYFSVDKIHEIALCLPRVNNPCKILEYHTSSGSSAKSSTTIKILNNPCCLFFFWKSVTWCCVSIICFEAIGSYSS